MPTRPSIRSLRTLSSKYMSTKYIPAGAGSGKTYKLTHDLAKMLTREDDPVEASRIILTTFTKSAAADFMRRAREVLIKEGHEAKAAELDGALIGTVHSICERFIKKYWYRLDQNLPLNIMSDADKKLFISRTTENVASDDDIKFFSSFAQEFEMDSDFWKESLESIIDKRYSFDVKDLDKSCRLSCEDIDKVFSGKKDDCKAIYDEKGKDMVFTPFLRRLLQLPEVASEDGQTAEDRRNRLNKALKGSIFLKAKLICESVKVNKKDQMYIFTQKIWDKMGEEEDFLQRIHDLASSYLVSYEVGARMKECVRKLFGLAESWEEVYKQFKLENRLLDYNDLEQLFLRILDEDEFEDVRQDIRGSYRVMMVDEFQDSNPVQIRIFKKMKELVGAPESNDDGTPVFREVEFVGDWKQAIYGFRGTESSLVDDFIKEIKDQKPLKESYRSRKDLVRAANEVFCNAFGREQLPVDLNDDAPYDGVSLLETRDEPEGMGPALQHWNSPEPPKNSVKNNYAAVGKRIHDLVESKTCIVVREKDDHDKEIPVPIDYGDIAILLRNGSAISEVADAFQKAHIPVSILESDFITQAEVQLILSLVRYVFNEEDKGAMADILHLIHGMASEDVISGSVTGQWSEDVKSFFVKLKAIRSRVSVLSVSEIVESLVLELGLYTNAAGWGLSDTRVRNIGFVCALATEYENQCSNINVSPTLPGFISYVSEYKPEKRLVDKTNTVKILTYHNAKGLDWPMVILDELDSFKTDDQTVIKKGYKGVHNFRGDNDEVLLHLFPRILYKKSPGDAFNTEQSLPDIIVNGIKATDLFDYVKKRRVEEETRLLYVGFTRAKDYLVTLGNPRSKYTWLTNCGAGVKDPVLGDEGFALWHSKYRSAFFDIAEPEESDTQDDRALHAWEVPERVNDGDKYKSPSRHDDKASSSDPKPSAILTEVFRGEKMVQHISGEESEAEGTRTDNKSTRCGTCIHHIFAAFDPDGKREEMEEMADRIIEGMGLSAEFPSPESVIDSAGQLFGWLRRQYGEGTPLHELPVVLKQEDGSIVRGEMDLIWELPGKKCVLVDYKSFHGSEDLRDIKAHAVLHGYPEQLKTYKETLEADGYTVQDALIYYFVLGRAIKFGV